MIDYTLAEVAFAAYCKSLGASQVQFSELSERNCNAWLAAALAAIEAAPKAGQ